MFVVFPLKIIVARSYIEREKKHVGCLSLPFSAPLLDGGALIVVVFEFSANVREDGKATRPQARIKSHETVLHWHKHVQILMLFF